MSLLLALVDLYSLIVFVAVILSWLPDARDNAFGRFIESATEPVLSAIRRVIPVLGGLDLSPMILLLALQLVKRLLR